MTRGRVHLTYLALRPARRRPSRSMTKYDWLLFLHVTGAFLFLGAAVVAWVLGIAAFRRERPSEVALLLGLAQIAGIGFGIGTTLLVVFGIWLVVDVEQYSIGDGWIVGALILLGLSLVIGGLGGGREKRTRMLAQRLANEGDRSSPELVAAVRDPRTLLYNIILTVSALAILFLMIFKPGAS
jgi:uncharacterized membrane protein